MGAFDPNDHPRKGDGKFAAKSPVAESSIELTAGVESPPERKLTAKQQAGLDHLRQNPSASIDSVIDAADIQGWDDNRGRYVLGLVSTGKVKMVVDESSTQKLTAKQQAAVDHLEQNPEASPEQMMQAAGVSQGRDNQSRFVLRVLRSGRVRLVERDD